MHYELRLSAPSLEVLPLAAIANAIAHAAATAGGTPFHKPTYQGKFRTVIDWILEDARAGRLAVTDENGVSRTFDEIIERAKGDGTYSEVLQKPSEEAIQKIRDDGIFTDAWQSTDVDVASTHALCVYTTLKNLNDWSRERGDEFSISRIGWIDERGWVEPRAVIEKKPTVIYLIDGREAIPVRTIPLVTGWEVSPDLLASSLAHSAEGLRLDRLPAYQLHADGSHTQTLPKEWDGVEDALEGLSATLRAKNSDRAASRPEWLRKSISLLPAGVFVWKDDFEKSFWRQFSADSPFGAISRDGKRPGDGELNYAPLMSQALRKKVFKGFARRQIAQTTEALTSGARKKTVLEAMTADDAEQAAAAIPAATQEPPKTGAKVEILRKRAAFINDFQGMWPTMNGDLSDAARNGLSLAANARHGFWRVGPALNWADERGRIKREKAEQFVHTHSDSELSILIQAMLDRK